MCLVASSSAAAPGDTVLRCTDIGLPIIERLLLPYGLQLIELAPAQLIPGSYWGEAEAGLVENRLYVRPDTPVHSALHEACHFICMDDARRRDLQRDAGGDYDEENAVCYLQILLSDQLHGCGRERMFRDMDAWGYTFRLGSARAWFEQDALDAAEWLKRAGVVDAQGAVTGRLR